MRASDAQQLSEVGDFSELTPLGGAGSEVFRARSRNGDRFVALRLWFGSSEDELEAVRERVVRAARVSHPMLATVEGCEERGSGALWIVTEYVPGPSLAAWYNGGRLLPLAAAIDLVRRLSQGLQVALENGVSHHAVTPRNIIVRRQDPRGGGLRLEAKLLDLERATWMRPGMPGLPAAHFMAPEALALALAGADPDPCLDARANVYACGALLYYLATGVYAFDSADYSQLTAALAGGAPIAPRRLNPRITDGLERVLLDALCVSPGGRPGDPAAFGTALEQCAARARSAWQQGAELLPDSMQSAIAFAQSGEPAPAQSRQAGEPAPDSWDALVRELTNPDLGAPASTMADSSAREPDGEAKPRRSMRPPARPTLRGPLIDAWPGVTTKAKIESVSSSDTPVDEPFSDPYDEAAEEGDVDAHFFGSSPTDDRGETLDSQFGSAPDDRFEDSEEDEPYRGPPSDMRELAPRRDLRDDQPERDRLSDVQVSQRSAESFAASEQDDESAAAVLAATADDELGPPIVYSQPESDEADPDLVRTYEAAEAELALHGASSSGDADDAEEWDDLELIPSAEDDGLELDYAQAHVTRPDPSEDDEVDELARTRTLGWRPDEDTGLSGLHAEKPATWSVHHDADALQADIARQAREPFPTRTSDFAPISEVDLLEEPVTIPIRARLPIQRDPGHSEAFEWAPTTEMDALPRPGFPETAPPAPVETLSYRGVPYAGRVSQPPFPLHETPSPGMSPIDAVQRHSAQLRAAQRQGQGHEPIDPAPALRGGVNVARADFEAARRGRSAQPEADRLPPPPRARTQTPADYAPQSVQPNDLDVRVTSRVPTPAPRPRDLESRSTTPARPRSAPPGEIAPYPPRASDLEGRVTPGSRPRTIPPGEASPFPVRAGDPDPRSSRPRTLPPEEASPYAARAELDSRSAAPTSRTRSAPPGEVAPYGARAELEAHVNPAPRARTATPSPARAGELDGRLTPAPRRSQPPGEISPSSELDGRFTPASRARAQSTQGHSGELDGRITPAPRARAQSAQGRSGELDGRITPAPRPRSQPPGDVSPFGAPPSDLDGRFTPASRARVQTPSHTAPRGSTDLDARFTPASRARNSQPPGESFQGPGAYGGDAAERAREFGSQPSQPHAQTPSGRGPATQTGATGAGRRLQRATLPPGFQASQVQGVAPANPSARATSQLTPLRLEQFSRPPSRARRAWMFSLWLSLAALAAAAISYFIVMRFTRPEPQPTLMSSTLSATPAPPAPTETREPAAPAEAPASP